MTQLENSILIVEDEFLIAHALQLLLEGIGLAVCGRADNAEDALALAIRHRPKVILIDARLKGAVDGVDAARAIREAIDARIIFLTGSRDPEMLAHIQTAKPSAVLIKPAARKELIAAVSAAMAT